MALPFALSDAHLRRRYTALLQGESVLDDDNNVIETDYERWRELKRMVIVHGLPRDEGVADHKHSTASSSSNGVSAAHDSSDGNGSDSAAVCSLRGRIWKVFLGVDAAIDGQTYRTLAAQGASYCDDDIRNDTFRTFRGDPAFAQRVPEEKLARLLNVFINELGARTTSSSASKSSRDYPEDIRYVQGMNVLCAPLLYVMPEADAYYAFCELIVKHCPHYMAPKLKGVERACVLVDKCLQTLDADLFDHLQSHGITARIYALPLVLSLFACAPPLDELLRVWDVLFAVGVHFVVVLAVAHTVLLRDALLHKDVDLMKVLGLRFAPPLQADLLLSVALQLLHRLPDDLVYEIARHPFEHPESIASLPLPVATVESVLTEIRRQQQPLPATVSAKEQLSARASSASTGRSARAATRTTTAAAASASAKPRERKRDKAALTFFAMAQSIPSASAAPARPPWKI